MQQQYQSTRRISSTRATDTDWARPWREVLTAPPLQEWRRVWNDVFDAWNRAAQAAWEPVMQPQRRTHDCDCPDDCAPDHCHCQCCVSDADLLVHARVGDRQIVPLVIENNRRREREVELQLSDWTTHKEQTVQVMGQILEPTKFTLAACEERAVVLIIEVTGSDRTTEASESTSTATVVVNQLPDVDSCKVYYTDLRVKGCDIRPIRVAVAVLPRDCTAHPIDCHCGCC